MNKKSIVWGMAALTLTFGFMAAGCDTGGDDDNSGNVVPSFVAVADIGGVIGNAADNVPNYLLGTVTPTNATNQTIVWLLAAEDAGKAALAGNVLTPSADSGTVTVTATIAKGKSETQDFTRDFAITLNELSSTVAGLYALLGELGANTADRPYLIALVGDEEDYDSSDLNMESASATIKNAVKYLFLDLRGCADTTIAGASAEDTQWPAAKAIKDNQYVAGLFLPGGVTAIADHSLRELPHVVSVVVPATVTAIGNSAFTDCGKLANIALGEGLTDIGPFAFYQCPALRVVAIPGSVIKIENMAFAPSQAPSTSLTTVIFGDGSNIPGANFNNYAFDDGTLRSLYLGANPHAGIYTRASGSWTKL